MTLRWDERGLAELQAQFDDGSEAVAEAMAQRARDIAPSVTGEYRDSIHVERDGDDVRVVADAPYSVFVEYGTSDTPAFAPLTRAQDEVAPQIPAIVASKVR